MATQQPQSLTSKELTCTICESMYVDPKVLPCLHYYCKRCLEGLVQTASEKKSHITCPQCQEVHELLESGVDGLKTFFTINNLLELLQILERNGVILCESGLDPEDEERLAFARCLTCSHYLCESCFKIHKKQRMSKGHEIIALEEVRQADRKQGARSLQKKKYCEEHKSEALELFCNTCKPGVLICRDCALSKHREHDYKFISEIRSERQGHFEQRITTVEAQQLEFEGHKEYLDTLDTFNESTFKSCTAEIQKMYEKLVEKLKQHQATLLSEVWEIYDAETKQINEEEASVSLALERFTNGVYFTRQILGNGDDADVVSMSCPIRNALETLGKMTWDKDSVQPPPIRLKIDPKITSTKSFGTVLHNIHPDDIAVIDFPTNDVLVGARITFTVYLALKIFEKGHNVDVSEIAVTIRYAHTENEVPIKVNSIGENCWSVSFIPLARGTHNITINLAGIIKTLTLTAVSVPKAQAHSYEVINPDFTQTSNKSSNPDEHYYATLVPAASIQQHSEEPKEQHDDEKLSSGEYIHNFQVFVPKSESQREHFQNLWDVKDSEDQAEKNTVVEGPRAPPNKYSVIGSHHSQVHRVKTLEYTYVMNTQGTTKSGV